VKTPHLLPALGALLLAAGALLGGRAYALRVEAQSVHALAANLFPLKSLGIALQRAAFRQPDLLPAYGSSELENRDDYDARRIFKDYPTEFTIFPIAHMGTSALIVLEKLAAIGPEASGKKVVVSFTPPTFFRPLIGEETYAGNFSRLHAGELVFSNCLSYDVRQRAARLMLLFPKTLESEPLLKFGAESLADDSWLGRCLYHVAWPLGKLENFVWECQDHWETLRYLEKHPVRTEQAKHQSPRTIHWDELAAAAQRSYRQYSGNNPFGFKNKYWQENAATLQKRNPMPPWSEFQPLVRAIVQSPRTLKITKEWQSLELLMQGINELGLDALVLSTPMNAAFYDSWGADRSARQVYYDKFADIAGRYGVPCLTFSEHEADRDFLMDAASHLSSRGWVYYARVIDAFFHSYDRDDFCRLAKSFTAAAPAVASKAPADKTTGAVASYEGTLDRADRDRISGWAWDHSRPDEPIKIDILDGGQVLATVLANQFRQGLRDGGKGDGRHGFAIITPKSLQDSRRHTIDAIVAGTKVHLNRSPRVLESAAPK
jgi:D-alanine transfer protein